MKLFLIGIGHTRPEQIDVARKLKENHEIQYWVRMDQVFTIDEMEFPNTIFHTYKDAIAGKPAPGVDTSHFDPPSAELLEDLTPYESELLTMMNKWYPEWGVNKRKDFYYDLLRYWGGVLDAYTPEAIVFSEMPHEVYSFVLFALAKYRGVHTLMFENVLRYDRHIIYEDYRLGNRALAEEAAKGFPVRATIEDLSLDVQDYYLEQTGVKDEMPKYVASFRQGYRGFNYWKSQLSALGSFVRDGSVFRRVIARFTKLFSSNLKREYQRFAQKPDLQRSYIYVALHFQPERTTSPQGGVYVDQILMVKTLAARLPKDWVLYVKEHPVQWLPSHSDYVPYRYRDYYRELAAIKNVVLVPIETNTFTLMRHARAVATVTGIPGWEALLRGIPALVFGHAWYKHCPGAFLIGSPEDCAVAYQRISEGAVVDSQKTLNFLACLEKQTFVSFTDEYTKAFANISPQESAENMRLVLEHALEESFNS